MALAIRRTPSIWSTRSLSTLVMVFALMMQPVYMLMASQVANAAELITVVTPSSMAGWTATSGTPVIVNGPAGATGTGSLKLSTVSEPKQMMQRSANATPLSEVSGLGYRVMVESGIPASYQMYVTGMSGTSSWTYLVWEPVYNGHPNGPNGGFVDYSSIESGTWWSSQSVEGAPNRDTFVSLATIMELNPDAVAQAFGPNVGSGTPNATSYVDTISFNGATYSFELDAVATNVTTGTSYASLQEAIDAATAGDEIRLEQGTTVTDTIALNKALTINGNGQTISTSGGNQLFAVTANGVTVQGLVITKTDNVNQHFIGVQSSDVSVTGSTFRAQYDLVANAGTTRALVVSNGVSNLVIDGNTFENIRQPAYLNNSAGGTISNNHVHNTRGWVVEKNTDFAFLGNTWGTNAVDIAIIEGSNTALQNNYTCELFLIRAANNNANIDDQAPATDCETAAPTMSNINMFVNGTDSDVAKTGDTVRVVADVADPSGVDRIQLWVRDWPYTGRQITAGQMTHVSGNQYEFVYTMPATYNNGDPINETAAGNYYNFRPYDGLGNSQIGWRNNFTVDNADPVLTLNGSTTPNRYHGPGVVRAQIADANFDRLVIEQRNGDGQFEHRFTYSAATHSGTSFTIQWLGDGDYRIQAFDAAGNASERYEFVIDTTVPTTEITGATINGDNLTFTGSVSDPNLRYYYCWLTTNQIVTVDGHTYTPGQEVKLGGNTDSTRNSACNTTWANGETGFSGAIGAFNITGFPVGSYTINLVAYDLAGNSNVTEPARYVVAIEEDGAEVEVPVVTPPDPDENQAGGDSQAVAFASPLLGGDVLGMQNQSNTDTDSENDADNNDVLGDQDENGTPLADTAAFGASDNLLGFAWYWWLAIIGGLVAGWLLLAAALRRRNEEEA